MNIIITAENNNSICRNVIISTEDKQISLADLKKPLIKKQIKPPVERKQNCRLWYFNDAVNYDFNKLDKNDLSNIEYKLYIIEDYIRCLKIYMKYSYFYYDILLYLNNLYMQSIQASLNQINLTDQPNQVTSKQVTSKQVEQISQADQANQVTPKQVTSKQVTSIQVNQLDQDNKVIFTIATVLNCGAIRNLELYNDPTFSKYITHDYSTEKCINKITNHLIGNIKFPTYIDYLQYNTGYSSSDIIKVIWLNIRDAFQEKYPGFAIKFKNIEIYKNTKDFNRLHTPSLIEMYGLPYNKIIKFIDIYIYNNTI
jgi:hypothetical protein